MKMSYDKQADAVYITLTNGVYDRSKKITPSMVVDVTKKGKVLGIEILDASENIQDLYASGLVPTKGVKSKPPGYTLQDKNV